MINIATPIFTKQANGSFAENTNEINKQQISASYHETVPLNTTILENNKAKTSFVALESKFIIHNNKNY